MNTCRGCGFSPLQVGPRKRTLTKAVTAAGVLAASQDKGMLPTKDMLDDDIFGELLEPSARGDEAPTLRMSGTLCRSCGGAFGLKAWIENGCRGGWTPPEGTMVVWFPEATQEFASILGRSIMALETLAWNVASGKVRKAADGAQALKLLLERRDATEGVDALARRLPTQPHEAEFVDGLRVVETSAPERDVKAWLEEGTFATLNKEHIEKTGAYLD